MVQKLNLYSKKRLFFHTNESLLVNDRVFTGNQIDDFAIAGLQCPNQILLLGVGYGGAIKGIIASNPDAHVTAVDINAVSLQTCENLYAEFFPELLSQISFIHDDASHFIQNIEKNSFDAICIDLYHPNGYAEVILEEVFWENMNSSLSMDGIILANSWGLPSQLDPLTYSTAQTKMLKLMSRFFPNIKALPSRRNITFLASKADLRIKYPELSGDLKSLDQIGLKLLFFKAYISKNIDVSQIIDIEDNILYTIEDLDNLMYQEWGKLLNEINHIRIKAHLNPLSQVNDLLDYPDEAQRFTEAALMHRPIIATTIPTLAGGMAFVGNKKLDWYIKWLVEEKSRLMMIDLEWFVNIACWQAYQIATNPYAGYEHWVPHLEKLLFTIQSHVLATNNI
ncbi:spermidine synthase [Viridibacillus arvi]|uniref:spermidine synthase n=1 Tax=Viridibacillus arvi TaxID=263475 RepID=UPI003D083368